MTPVTTLEERRALDAVIASQAAQILTLQGDLAREKLAQKTQLHQTEHFKQIANTLQSKLNKCRQEKRATK